MNINTALNIIYLKNQNLPPIYWITFTHSKTVSQIIKKIFNIHLIHIWEELYNIVSIDFLEQNNCWLMSHAGNYISSTVIGAAN